MGRPPGSGKVWIQQWSVSVHISAVPYFSFLVNISLSATPLNMHFFLGRCHIGGRETRDGGAQSAEP